MCAISHESGDNLKKGVLYMYFTFKKVNDNLVTIDARTDNGEVKAKSFTNPTRPVDLGTFALFALNLGEAMDADLVEPEQLVFCYDRSYKNLVRIFNSASYVIFRSGRFEPHTEEMPINRQIALLEDNNAVELNKENYKNFFKKEIEDALHGRNEKVYTIWKCEDSIYISIL